jgi:hypothetical protein
MFGREVVGGDARRSDHPGQTAPHRGGGQDRMFVRDLRVAIRSLWKTKTLAFAVVVTVALGIGVNAAIVSLVRAVLLKPSRP